VVEKEIIEAITNDDVQYLLSQNTECEVYEMLRNTGIGTPPEIRNKAIAHVKSVIDEMHNYDFCIELNRMPKYTMYQ